MKSFRNVWKGRALAIVMACVLPFILFSYGLKPSEGRNAPQHFLQEFIYPLEYSWRSTKTAISLHWQRFQELNIAATENIRLRKENDILKLQQVKFEELQNENRDLRNLLQFQKSAEDPSVAVEILSPNRKDLFQTIRIGKGRNEDLNVGMPVVTTSGVFGKIIRVGLHHSDVQLLTDANFHLDVVIQRTRTRAILQGTGDGLCKLKLENTTQVKIGDTVVTSGVVGSFPKGIPVGRISKINYSKDYISQNIVIEPWVDPYNHEYALVLRREDKDIERIIESTSSSWLEKTTALEGRRQGG